MIKNVADLEKSLKLPDGALKQAIESTEEVVIELPKLKIYTEDEENARIENIRTEAKTAGLEMGIKDARNKFSLSFEGKTIDNLLTSYKAKVLEEAKINPDKKVQELTGDLEKLRTNYSTLEGEFATFKTTVSKERDQQGVDTQILSKIPKETIIPGEDILQLFRTKHEIEKTETGIVIKKDGQVLKNPTTLNPKTIEEVVNEFATPYLKTPGGGSGRVDETGNPKQGTKAAFDKEMTDKGVNVGSSEYNYEMQKRIKEKTLTV